MAEKSPQPALTLDSNVRVADGVLSDALSEEALLLDVGSGTYFGLNPMGREIWDGLKAGLAPRAIAAVILETHAVEPQRIEKDLLRFLRELQNRGLVTVSEA